MGISPHVFPRSRQYMSAISAVLQSPGFLPPSWVRHHGKHPIGVIEILPVAADGIEPSQGGFGEEESGGIRSKGEDAIFWKSEVDGSEKTGAPDIHVDGGGPVGGANQRNAGDEALVFHGPGPGTDADAVVSVESIGVAGIEDDHGSGFGGGAHEQGEFDIITNGHRHFGATGLENLERGAAACYSPLLAFEAGHHEFVLKKWCLSGSENPSTVDEPAMIILPGETSGYDGDLMAVRPLSVDFDPGFLPFLHGLDLGRDIIGRGGHAGQAGQLHRSIFREDDDPGSGSGGLRDFGFQARGQGMEIWRVLDLMGAEGKAEGVGHGGNGLGRIQARGLVQKTMGLGNSFCSPISFQEKVVWSSGRRSKPRFRQKAWSGW